VVKVTAGYIAATQLQPGGGSVAPGGDSGWKPRAPIKAPPVSPVPPAVPARDPTKYDILGDAYRKASDSLSDRCHLPFALLMAIGEVESSSLRGRKLDAGHDVVPPVLGPQLSGGGFAAIGDSDGGRLDGDSAWDRAVGPMQFIPGTWRLWGADGNGDGVADPQNVEDAALAAGRYLCAGGRDLSRREDLEAAILSYNHSRRYLATVLDLYDSVMSGLVAGP
jgi:Membrane-bound lytic murein transglycosylase B